MRQSPTLLALLTLSATLGLAGQARGETLVASPTAPVRVVDLAEPTADGAALAATDNGPEPSWASTSIRLDATPSPGLGSQPQGNAAEEPDAIAPARTPTADLDPDAATLPDPAAPVPYQAPTVARLSEPQGIGPVQAAVDWDGEATPAVPPADLPTVETLAQAQDPTPEEETTDPETDQETTEETPAETRVLVAEVEVEGANGADLPPELERRVYDVVTTEPGRTTTRSQIQQDINSIFATGVFANVRATPSDTALGVRVTFVVQPNPVLSRVEVQGNEVLPAEVIENIFSPQYGEIIDLIAFQDSIVELNEWYQENGYVLAQVVAAPQIAPNGVVTLVVAEGVIEDIQVRFLNEEGLAEDEDGNPVGGRTRDFIITREFRTEPGDVFRQDRIQADLQRVFALGIFDDLGITLNPGDEDPRKVNLIVNVVERNTGSVAAGLGFNFTGDIFGTLSYRQENFGGNNQQFSAETQLSTRDLLFDVSFTDPWIAGDPNRTSYTLNGFARRSIPLTFDNGTTQINLTNGDRVRLNRYGGGVSFRRPLGGGWAGSIGTSYTRVRVTDAEGAINTVDAVGNPLSASGTGVDDLWTVQLGLVRDLRNDALNPTQGSVLRFGTEQSIPLGSGNIFLNRLRGSYSYYVPVDWLSFGEGPQSLAFNLQGGTILGDLPPYESFSLGGTNSVRGYEEGSVGSGRSYLQATVEYRFPVFSFVGGALFVDAATDLGSGSAVPGDPAGDRGKPGNGFGYGAGLRVQTPLGPIRIDYGFNDRGNGRLHFGIGERF